jgi:hypothetical protein
MGLCKVSAKPVIMPIIKHQQEVCHLIQVACLFVHFALGLAGSILSDFRILSRYTLPKTGGKIDLGITSRLGVFCGLPRCLERHGKSQDRIVVLAPHLIPSFP